MTNDSRLYLSVPVNVLVEGYPIDMQTPPLASKSLSGYSGFMGIASVFRDAGFVEVGRASETRLIMRCIIEP